MILTPSHLCKFKVISKEKIITLFYDLRMRHEFEISLLRQVQGQVKNMHIFSLGGISCIRKKIKLIFDTKIV